MAGKERTVRISDVDVIGGHCGVGNLIDWGGPKKGEELE